jgi:hypothetical protein
VLPLDDDLYVTSIGTPPKNFQQGDSHRSGTAIKEAAEVRHHVVSRSNVVTGHIERHVMAVGFIARDFR